MEKTITVRRTTITFSIWDLGGQREFVNMLPLVCNDAVAILFMFDLSRKSTLNSVKEWYRQARGFNKVRSLALQLSSSYTRPTYLAVMLVNCSSCPCPDCHTIPDRHEIRHFLYFPSGRTRRDYETGECMPRADSPMIYFARQGQTIRESNACVLDFLLNLGVHQCPEDLQNRVG